MPCRHTHCTTADSDTARHTHAQEYAEATADLVYRYGFAPDAPLAEEVVASAAKRDAVAGLVTGVP